jgi:hypothetical protein
MDRVRQWLKLDELLEKERQASLPGRAALGQKKGGREAVRQVGGGGEGRVSLLNSLFKRLQVTCITFVYQNMREMMP